MEVKKSLEESSKYIMNTYRRFPVVFKKGRGMKLWSSDGKEYLDFLAGVAVNALGHSHPRLVIEIQKQAQRLIHISNFYQNEPQIKLSKLLINHSFADKVFFSNSGAEANEAAIKLARKYSKDNFAAERTDILTAVSSFHGRTIGTLSATGQEKIQKGFDPLLPGFKYVPYNDIEAIKSSTDEKTCAIMLEPIQGEGGVRMPSDDYFVQVRSHCNKNDLMLILDEVQTGIGRTGRLFAYENFDIEPDIITLAKALGGGMPIGATLAREKIAKSFDHGTHGSTFGGGALACAAAIVTIETILEDGIILSECKRLGKYFITSLKGLKNKFPDIIVNVRGMGLLIGMELVRGAGKVVHGCFERGILINNTDDNTLRFSPPLIVKEEDINILIDVLIDVLERLS